MMKPRTKRERAIASQAYDEGRLEMSARLSTALAENDKLMLRLKAFEGHRIKTDNSRDVVKKLARMIHDIAEEVGL